MPPDGQSEAITPRRRRQRANRSPQARDGDDIRAGTARPRLAGRLSLSDFWDAIDAPSTTTAVTSRPARERNNEPQ